MKNEVVKTIVLIAFCVACIVLGMWLTQIIWDSNLPEWLKIWFVTH